MAVNDIKGALKDFDRGIELKPGVPAWHMKRADARDRSGDANGAVSDYQSVIIVEPRNMDALTALAAIYVRPITIPTLDPCSYTIINLQPAMLSPYLARGMAYRGQRQLPACRSRF